MSKIVFLLFTVCFITCLRVSRPVSEIREYTFYERRTTYIDSADDSPSWKFSTLEEQGINKKLFNEGIKKLEKSSSLCSFLVIRNGYLVSENYFNGSSKHHSNNVHSTSKSIVSALTGIALKRGYLSSEEQKLYDFFPEHFPLSDLPEKKEISLKHLLTMTSGIYWKGNYLEYKIDNHPNWIKEIINLPLVATPGKRFKYSSGMSHLLSAVLTKATGSSLLEFGNTYLFNPLGITVEHWGRDPQGNNSGGFNFYITARELAKFGMLYLNKGRWDSKQIIPEEWIEKSTSVQRTVNKKYSYGYYWWLLSLNGHAVYSARGYNGQYLFVIPDLSLVTVFTSTSKQNTKIIDANNIMTTYVLPAIIK